MACVDGAYCIALKDWRNSKPISITLNSAALALFSLLIYLLARKQVAAVNKIKMASPCDARNQSCLPIPMRWRNAMAAA